MKAVKFTIPLADINTGNEIKTDIRLLNSETGRNEIPQDLLIINDTATEIGLIYLDGDYEEVWRTDHPDWYDFTPIEAGRKLGSLPSSIHYVVFKKLTATMATEDLEFYGLNYQEV